MSLARAIEAWRNRVGVSLAGRLLAILLVVIAVDFVANSLMFERERSFAVSNEEAVRMAEHLVVARRLVAAAPPARRAEVARELSTDRFAIAWRDSRGRADHRTGLGELRRDMLAAEPELRGADLRLALVPIARGGGVEGSVLLPDGTALAFHASGLGVWSLNAGLLLRLSLPSLLLFAIAWWLVRRSFVPLQRLVAATRQVGTDRMDPLPEQGESEVRQLIHAFNRMHERISQLLADRTQTLLAVGHDLRTPLSRLQLRLDGAPLDEITREEMARDITEMADLLNSLQAYVDTGQLRGAPEAVDLAAMVRSQVDDAADSGLDATYDGPDFLEVRAHPSALRRAIANLLQNALRYAGNAEVGLCARGAWVELSVADRGPGIPPDRLHDVLQPFTRLDNARARDTRGMGLGLAIVDRVIEAEGGRLELANRPGGGLIVTIRLPAPLPGR